MSLDSFDELTDEAIEELLDEPYENLTDDLISKLPDESLAEASPVTSPEQVAESVVEADIFEQPLEELPEPEICDLEHIEDIPEQLEERSSPAQEPEIPVPEDLFSDKPQWQADFNSLSERIKGYSQGIELPSEIFSASIDALDIETGIFLTYEKTADLFVPFASTGMDETSLRRCKISMDVINENNLIFNGEIIHPAVKKTFLKNYLSKRLWDGINLVSVLVFSHHEDVFGLLLIFNSVITDKPGFTDLASLLIRNSSEAFSNSRSTLLRNLKSAEANAPLSRLESAGKISSDLKELTSELKIEGTLKIAFIDYSIIISSMKEFDEAIDEYAIEFDIFRMYSSMIGSCDYIQRIENHCIFLTFLSKMTGNTALLKNQLEASLISLFEKNKLISNPVISVDELDQSDDDFTEKLSAFLI